jgi:hypothetical protein
MSSHSSRPRLPQGDEFRGATSGAFATLQAGPTDTHEADAPAAASPYPGEIADT